MKFLLGSGHHMQLKETISFTDPDTNKQVTILLFTLLAPNVPADSRKPILWNIKLTAILRYLHNCFNLFLFPQTANPGFAWYISEFAMI